MNLLFVEFGGWNKNTGEWGALGVKLVAEVTARLWRYRYIIVAEQSSYELHTPLNQLCLKYSSEKIDQSMCQISIKSEFTSLLEVTCYFHVLMLTNQYVFSIEVMVHGYHEYKDIWDTPVGGILPCQRNKRNIYDMFAVAVVKEGTIVGHCPRKFSAPCLIFIKHGGSITCQVTKWKALFVMTSKF